MFLIERWIKFLLAGVLALSLAGCGSTKLLSCEDGRDPIWLSNPGKEQLEKGTVNYVQGNYPVAMIRLQRVVDLPSATKAEKIESHKLMAFIHCISGREKMCADSFKKAIQLDPQFDLTPAEIGHPIWGPVFRSVKKMPVN